MKNKDSENIYVKRKNEGLSLRWWYERMSSRSDLPIMLTHLTKPSKKDMKSILGSSKTISDQMREDINHKSVDTLLAILEEGLIKGSTTDSGYVVGKTPAACFQELPYPNIIENIKLEMKRFRAWQHEQFRYSGVGISFDRFLVYAKGGRPVLYEDTETAKNILPEDQHWRIVNLTLKRDDPYVENLFGPEGEPCIAYDLKTTIVDWTFEREWRVPNQFKFDLERDFIAGSHYMSLVFPDEATYEYFIDKQQTRDVTIAWEDIRYSADRLGYFITVLSDF